MKLRFGVLSVWSVVVQRVVTWCVRAMPDAHTDFNLLGTTFNNPNPTMRAVP